MADVIDVANDLIDTEVSRQLNKIRQNAAQRTRTQGPKQCVECGEDMLEERRKLGFVLCFSCATERERRQSLFADE